MKEGIWAYHPFALPIHLVYDYILVLSKYFYLEIKKELIGQGFYADTILLWDNHILPPEIFSGKAGLEIEGPSDFSRIYNICQSCDGVNFAAHTVWANSSIPDYMFVGQKLGGMIIADATDLRIIADEIYDSLLFSNNLEHIASPLKALREFRRVTKPSDIICVLIPQKKFTIDHNWNSQVLFIFWRTIKLKQKRQI